MLVINVISTKKSEENRVHYLDVTSKKDILKLLENQLTYPRRYVTAKAEALKVEVNQEIQARDMTTLNEYLISHNIEVSKSVYPLLATKVAKLYKDKYLVNPRRIIRPDPNGIYNRKSYAYADEDLWIIEEALKQFTHTRKPA